ncbi:hypothetical protein ACJX0J_033788, partial [Zea mays]
MVRERWKDSPKIQGGIKMHNLKNINPKFVKPILLGSKNSCDRYHHLKLLRTLIEDIKENIIFLDCLDDLALNDFTCAKNITLWNLPLEQFSIMAFRLCFVAEFGALMRLIYGVGDQ